MGMTREEREKHLDWLYRLKSEIFVFMPKDWLTPFADALDVAIDTVKREEMLEDWTKKCRKFEADYENRLKADMVAMLTEIQLEIEEVRLERPLMSRGHECYGFEDKTPTEIRQECSDVIQQKINALKGDQEGKQ